MKIIFMLNLAHTPSTTSQKRAKIFNAHSREKAEWMCMKFIGILNLIMAWNR
jgi:hypothetical protein